MMQGLVGDSLDLPFWWAPYSLIGLLNPTEVGSGLTHADFFQVS